MLVIESGAVPPFVSVEVCADAVVPTGWPLNVIDDGLSVTAGAVAAPVPVSGTLCGLSPALSATEIVAVRVPTPVGVNVTEIEHEEPAASVSGNVGHVEVDA